jgi:ribonucleoside-diphosphate reductase alpha chain
VRKPNRDARRFTTVTAISNADNGDTYCVNEPLRNKVVFNGILTGNCLEIALPTKPMSTREEEIALCTLAAFNLGVLEDLDELEELAKIIVRALDNLLDYQNYPVKAAEKNKMRRTLGIGVINFANYLASHGARYSDGSGNSVTHELFEAIQYWLLNASAELAREKGQCEWFNDTKYAEGIMPIDRYKKDIDELHNAEYLCDWEALRSKVNKHGLRNSTLTALMPSETSSQVSNATNGIEPPRGIVTVKGSKDGTMKQVVPPLFGTYNYGAYEYLWDMPSNRGYIELVGIMQKFVDQAISANTNYDPANYPDNKVPMDLLIQDMLLAYKYGVKTLYYHNTKDGAEDKDEVTEKEDEGCEGGACKI